MEWLLLQDGSRLCWASGMTPARSWLRTQHQHAKITFELCLILKGRLRAGGTTVDVTKEVPRSVGLGIPAPSRLDPGWIRGPTAPSAAPRPLDTGMGHPASPRDTQHLPRDTQHLPGTPSIFPGIPSIFPGIPSPTACIASPRAPNISLTPDISPDPTTQRLPGELSTPQRRPASSQGTPCPSSARNPAPSQCTQCL